jgi:putative transposon-encoded protein
MARIILENGEEAIERVVSKFGRIDGLKRWVGRTVKLVVLRKDDKE